MNSPISELDPLAPLEWPSVTVIMPVRNEGAFISRSVGSVLEQDYPADRTEIMIVDGMSTDGTRAFVQSLAQRDPRVRLIDNPRQIVAPGLNRAFALASGDIIVRVDGHCEVPPDYVRRCVAHLVSDGVEAVGGAVDTIGETPVARVIAAAMSCPFGVGNSAFRTTRDHSMLADTVPFPAYTRAAIVRAGPYCEELVRNQDDEYNYRLREMNTSVLLAHDVSSRYYTRGSLRSLWRQYFQYGYWKVRVMQKHPRQMRPRQFAPPTFAGALILGVLGWMAGVWPAWVPGALVALYTLVNLYASIRVATRKSIDLPVLLPVTFSILHLAYGTGFLFGLVKFWNGWDLRGLVPAIQRD